MATLTVLVAGLFFAMNSINFAGGGAIRVAGKVVDSNLSKGVFIVSQLFFPRKSRKNSEDNNSLCLKSFSAIKGEGMLGGSL